MIVPVMCLVILPGCASFKYTLRDTSGTLIAIATLSQQNNDEATERLYNAEECILNSCRAFFKITYTKLIGKHTPLLTWFNALFSSKECRQAINIARQELDATNIQYNEVAIVN